MKTKKNLNTECLEGKLIQMKKKLTVLSQKNNQDMEAIKSEAELLLAKSEETNVNF